MEKLTLNIEQSEQLYRKGRKHYEPKMCYMNIYNMAYSLDNYARFQSGKLKIAYGYKSSVANLLVRHCFVINDAREVIDPTLFCQPEPDVNSVYYVMYEFPTMKDYWAALEKEGYYPALLSFLRSHNALAHQWAQANGFILYG